MSHTETITIARLAQEYGQQPYEIAAAFDLEGAPDDYEIEEGYARWLLDLLASEVADRA